MMGVWSNDRLFILPEGIRLMSQAPKDTRTPAEKARDTAGIIGSLMHEGYVPNPEDEAIHQGPSGAKSPPSNSSLFFANAPLSESERRWRGSVGNPAKGVSLLEEVEPPWPLGVPRNSCVITDNGRNCD
jgi:hypothetical protein